MGQCMQMERVGNTTGLIEFELQCPNEAVLYGHCEAHLTPRERAVWTLLKAADTHVSDGVHCMIYDTDDLRRAVAAVKASQ